MRMGKITRRMVKKILFFLFMAGVVAGYAAGAVYADEETGDDSTDTSVTLTLPADDTAETSVTITLPDARTLSTLSVYYDKDYSL